MYHSIKRENVRNLARLVASLVLVILWLMPDLTAGATHLMNLMFKENKVVAMDYSDSSVAASFMMQNIMNTLL